MKDKIVNTIQKQLLELTNYKFSKKYIVSYIIPILDYIVFSNKKKFIIAGSQGIGKSTLLYILEKNIKLYYNKNVLTLS
jgi:Predicted kinase